MASIARTKIVTLVEIILRSQLPSDAFLFNPEFAPATFKFALPLRVSHQSDQFYFDVDYGSNNWGNDCFIVTSFPGSGPLENEEYASGWVEVVGWFENWIESFKAELTEPDPYSLLRGGSFLANQVPMDLEGELFDSTDSQELHDFINSIRQFILSEASPTGTETNFVDERLAYLERAATRLTKQDWAHLASGEIFTIAVGLGLDSDQRERLQSLTLSFIRSLFRRLLT
ncbi:MAG: hypothetical protein QOK48_2830 [Blastocatellia bacterium]|jgi:hypothetical protein|nr:hypothetical protein [Blastocatellia bacterium]